MTVRYFKHRAGRFQWTIKEWECCGHIWQLMLSKNYPERYHWKPVCPTCGRSK